VTAAPAASSAASKLVSDANVSASSQVGSAIARMRSTWSSVWQRRIASTGAGSTCSYSKAASSVASLSCDSG
jgi:hypothetical protein